MARQEGAEEMKERNYWQNRERQQPLGKRSRVGG
jgi:hypothetical protein